MEDRDTIRTYIVDARRHLIKVTRKQILQEITNTANAKGASRVLWQEIHKRKIQEARQYFVAQKRKKSDNKDNQT